LNLVTKGGRAWGRRAKRAVEEGVVAPSDKEHRRKGDHSYIRGTGVDKMCCHGGCDVTDPQHTGADCEHQVLASVPVHVTAVDAKHIACRVGDRG
jgi:hypothetical protein